MRESTSAREITAALRGKVEHAEERHERRATPRPAIHWRDADELEWYAATGRDLVQRSPLGAQLERLHDEVGPNCGLPSTNPSWIIDYSEHTDSARSRRIAMRLQRASALYAPAAAVLLALHDPAAVGADGVTIDGADGQRTTQGRVDVGRILAVYPMTPTAAEARRWAGCGYERLCAGALGRLSRLADPKAKPTPVGPLDRISQVVTLGGRSPHDALRLLAAAKRSSHGDERATWNAIHREATELVRLSAEAWSAGRDDPRSCADAVEHSGRGSRSLAGVAGEALPA